jgi:hypothetical protein
MKGSVAGCMARGMNDFISPERCYFLSMISITFGCLSPTWQLLLIHVEMPILGRI